MLNSLSNASMKRNVSSRRVAPGTAGSQSILNPCNTDLWYHNTIVIRKYKRLFQIVKSDFLVKELDKLKPLLDDCGKR